MQRALICNGLYYDEVTRTVREGGAPDAEYLAREREDAVAQATQLLPLALSIVRPEDRSVVTARVLHALNVAQLIPVPPWLCVHAWRNGLAAAEFRFKLSDGEDALVAALEQHAADMLTLYTSPRIPEPAVHRIMNGICRPTQLPRLSAARAAGALPASFEVKLKLMDADNCCTFFGNSYGLQGEQARCRGGCSVRAPLPRVKGWMAAARRAVLQGRREGVAAGRRRLHAARAVRPLQRRLRHLTLLPLRLAHLAQLSRVGRAQHPAPRRLGDPTAVHVQALRVVRSAGRAPARLRRLHRPFLLQQGLPAARLARTQGAVPRGSGEGAQLG